MSRALHLIRAPTALGLRPPAPGVIPGTRLAPAALAAAGLRTRLKPVEETILNEPPYSTDLDPGTGVRNLPALIAFSRELAGAVGQALDRQQFPLVIGGDCSVLLGGALALRRRGRHGLLFLDGHCDFANPENSATYASVAGMDLALATGRGVAALADLDGLRPYFRDDDVFLFGDKEDADSPTYTTQDLFRSRLELLRFPELRARGLAAAIERIRAFLTEVHVNGVWLHVDIDILAPEFMPAVDCPDPGGLTWDELAAVLDAVLPEPKVCGMELTIFDPTLDRDGELAKRLVDFLAARFQR